MARAVEEARVDVAIPEYSTTRHTALYRAQTFWFYVINEGISNADTIPLYKSWPM
jgi:hypothetical protein